MDAYCQNRLTIIGAVKELKRFYRDERWMKAASARHLDLLEHSPQRHAWQFDTDTPPLAFVRTISRQWSNLTFLLDYDCEDERLKGLAKARKGKLHHFRVSY